MASAGGSVPYPALLIGAGAAGAGGGIWALVAGTEDPDAFWKGAGVGIGVCVAWLIYSIAVVGVLRLAGKDHTKIARERRAD
ncbi:hypothetical protein [Kribbella amoyensis]|nr:hypothetical protein [Kribbella amoyensis]